MEFNQKRINIMICKNGLYSRVLFILSVFDCYKATEVFTGSL